MITKSRNRMHSRGIAKSPAHLWMFIMIFLLAASTASSFSPRTSAGASDNAASVDSLGMKVIVPAYFSPSTSDYWSRLATQAAEMPGRLYAIANVSNGPGSSYIASYESAFNNLQSNGGKVLGYVYTSYGSRALSSVESAIDAWYSFYPSINGILLDEQPNVSGSEAYFVQIYNYIKKKDSSAVVVTNPGTNTIQSYLIYNGQRAADVICTFETNQGFDFWMPASWCRHSSRNNFCVVPINTPSGDYINRVKRAASLNVGWIYCTDDNLPNPYDTLPSYFEAFWNYVAIKVNSMDGNGLIDIDGRFGDWLRVPKLDIAPNPTISGGTSPDSDADFTNLWAINDSTNFYLSYQVAGTLSTNYFYRVLIDADESKSTGYLLDDSTSIGADFMIENGIFYSYADTGGSNSSWTHIPGLFETDSVSRTEMSIPLNVLTATSRDSTIKIIFTANTTGRYGLADVVPADYHSEFYSYKMNSVVLEVRDNIQNVAVGFDLLQNYPNPFNPTTTIGNDIPRASLVLLTVYDVLGRCVSNLVLAAQTPGHHEVTFDASRLPSGVYFYCLLAGSYSKMKKLMVLK